MKFNTKQPLFD